MCGKILISIIITALLILTGYIVFQNRTSEKILTGLATALILGTVGILTTAIISLKEEKIVETYSACMFLKKEPLYLMNYGYKLILL